MLRVMVCEDVVLMEVEVSICLFGGKWVLCDCVVVDVIELGV